MITRKQQILVFLLSAVIIGVTGCIVSGTFVLDIKVTQAELEQHGNSYFTAVDLSGNEIWQEHRDKLDSVDLVGFELWLSNSGTATQFDMYVDPTSDPIYTRVGQIDSNATQVLRDLPVPVGKLHVTYGESFKYLVNMNTLTSLAKTGKFHVYATWTDATSLFLDSVRVVVTISASDT